MAGPKPNDTYSPVPSVQPNGSMPQNYLNVRANPNQFGAQVGQALQGAGKTIGALGEVAMQQAIQEQGMLNESVMTDYETEMNKEFGRIKGSYQSLKGLAAVAAHDKAVEEIIKVRQTLSAKAPNEAVRRGFNLLAARQEGFIIREFGEYKAGQIKVADRESAEASAQNSLDVASDPTIANNDAQFNENLSNIDFQVARIVDNLGYLTKDANGNPYFPDDESGQKAKAVYQKYLNQYQGQAWTNRIRTLAFDPQTGSVEKAVNVLTQNKDRIPSATYAALSSQLAPAYRNEQARQGADALINSLDDEYDTAITSGNISHGMRTIVEGLLPGINVTSGFRTPEKNAEVGGVDNSYHLSGNALDFTLPEGMTFDEVKERFNKAGFQTSELIDEGDHIHVAWESKEGTPVSKEAHSYVSKANYYRQNYSQIIDRARAEAERLHPGDSVFSDNYVARVEQRISNEIRQQELQVRASQDSVLSLIQGERTRMPLVNIDQLDTNPDPRIRESLANWRANDPYADVKINNLILANSRGKASTYGNNFYKLYTDAVTGKINNPSDVLPYVGAASNSPLTNTGYEILKKAINDRNTPEGAAWADQTQKFLEGIRSNMTSPIPGMKLPSLDENFQKSLMTLIPRIEAGKAAGKTPAELFDPQSKDYIGKDIKYPSRADINDAQHQANMEMFRSRQTNTVGGVTYNSLADVQKALKAGKITRKDAIDLAKSKGWVVDNPPPVPFGAAQKAGKKTPTEILQAPVKSDEDLQKQWSELLLKNYDYGKLIESNPLAYLGFMATKDQGIASYYKTPLNALGITYNGNSDAKPGSLEHKVLQEAGLKPENSKGRILLGPEFAKGHGTWTLEHELMHRGLQVLRENGYEEDANIAEDRFIEAFGKANNYGGHSPHTSALKYEDHAPWKESYMKEGLDFDISVVKELQKIAKKIIEKKNK